MLKLKYIVIKNCDIQVLTLRKCVIYDWNFRWIQNDIPSQIQHKHVNVKLITGILQDEIH